MKRFAILAFVAALLSTALSCSKNDDASVLVGEWHYMDYQDIENIEWDDYDLQGSTVFKSHHKGKSWDLQHSSLNQKNRREEWTR